MSETDPAKMKVVELRSMLTDRGLDARGNKAILVKRLQSALNREAGRADPDEGDDGAECDASLDDSHHTAGDEADEENAHSDSKGGSQVKKEPVYVPEEPTEDSISGADDLGGGDKDKSDRVTIKQEKDSKDQPTIKTEVKQEPNDTVTRHAEKRKRSRSRSPPSGGGQRGRPGSPQQSHYDEDFDDTLVALDTYNSDLNLIIDKTRYSAYPLTAEGFGFMWAGARAMYGFKTGKTCYEVKVTRHLDVSHLPSDEPNPHVVRVGFSVESTSMQLGEEPLSYGYGGTGKASTNCQFKNYGAEFVEGDTVTAFLNMDTDPVEISFAKNGRHQGVAYKIPCSQLEGQALYPHVLTKNCSFDVNLGQREEPWYPLPDNFRDYTFANCVPLDKRVRGTKAPKSRTECEMIMMCGLPGCGKSTWAAEYCVKNPEKKYNTLGTNNIIDKMKVMGLPRKRNYHGRWDVLIGMSTKCLNKMMQMGTRTLRNFILDQTNVYVTAQRRKMRPFEGFKRRAVVIVPTDEEFKRRCDKRDREEGKEIPDSAVLEMKANFGLPEEGPLFDNVEFIELNRDDAEPLVKQYNEEGRAAVGPPNKRFRPNDQSSGRGSRSGGYDNRNRGGGWQGGQRNNWDSGRDRNSGGGYRDRDRNSGGGYGGRGGSNRGGGNRDRDRGSRGGQGNRNWGSNRSQSSRQGQGYGGYGGGYGNYNQDYGWKQGSGGGGSSGYGNQMQGYGQGYGSQPYDSGYGQSGSGQQYQSYNNQAQWSQWNQYYQNQNYQQPYYGQQQYYGQQGGYGGYGQRK